MKLQLLASMPSARYDVEPVSPDGRGGNVLSKSGANRYFGTFVDASLLFSLSVLASPSRADDYVESSRLSARLNAKYIATSTDLWKRPNRQGDFHSGEMLYEWMQRISLRQASEGLVEVKIYLKLHSEKSWLAVEGNAYCYLTLQRD